MRLSVLLACAALVSRAASAQCSNGSPPPCGRAIARVPDPNSVAVLYLDNLSRDTADAFLADGLTEEIIIRLGQVQRLVVKSRFEVQRFRGRATALDPPILGRSLNAVYLVTGSVQRAGDRVRLRVALVRAATRALVWGDIIDRASSDLLTIESDIAREVATAITGRLLPEERTRLARPLTSDPVAYEEYLRGLRWVNGSYDEAALRGALAHFDRAIARDSGFAAALSGRALAWVWLADAFVTPREGYGRAREAANQALARDSSQALAYANLSWAVLSLDLDAHEAERLVRRAVALDPRGGYARTVLSQALYAQGRVDESIAEARRAWALDSLFSANGGWYAEALILGHRLDSAAALLPRFRAVAPLADADAVEGLLLARGAICRAPNAYSAGGTMAACSRGCTYARSWLGVIRWQRGRRWTRCSRRARPATTTRWHSRRRTPSWAISIAAWNGCNAPSRSGPNGCRSMCAAMSNWRRCAPIRATRRSTGS